MPRILLKKDTNYKTKFYFHHPRIADRNPEKLHSAICFHLVLAAVLLFLFIIVVLHSPQTEPHFALLLRHPIGGDAKELPHSLDGEAVSGLTVSEGHAGVGSLNGASMRHFVWPWLT